MVSGYRKLPFVGALKFMRLRIATAIVFAAVYPAQAEIKYPMPIPSECYELAQREGVSTVINSKWEATKARLRLARMRSSDPLVRQCKEAVARAKAFHKATGSLPN